MSTEMLILNLVAWGALLGYLGYQLHRKRIASRDEKKTMAFLSALDWNNPADRERLRIYASIHGVADTRGFADQPCAVCQLPIPLELLWRVVAKQYAAGDSSGRAVSFAEYCLHKDCHKQWRSPGFGPNTYVTVFDENGTAVSFGSAWS